MAKASRLEREYDVYYSDTVAEGAGCIWSEREQAGVCLDGMRVRVRRRRRCEGLP